MEKGTSYKIRSSLGAVIFLFLLFQVNGESTARSHDSMLHLMKVPSIRDIFLKAVRFSSLDFDGFQFFNICRVILPILP